MSKNHIPLATLSGSRNTDILLVILLAGMVVFASSRLKVYFMVNAARVQATRILSDGTRRPLEIPHDLERSGTAYGKIERRLKKIERKIHRYMENHIGMDRIPAGESYEWKIRYSVNTPQLDRTKVLTFPQ